VERITSRSLLEIGPVVDLAAEIFVLELLNSRTASEVLRTASRTASKASRTASRAASRAASKASRMIRVRHRCCESSLLAASSKVSDCFGVDSRLC
jgi:hypothetical protein